MDAARRGRLIRPVTLNSSSTARSSSFWPTVQPASEQAHFTPPSTASTLISVDGGVRAQRPIGGSTKMTFSSRVEPTF